MNIQTKTEIIEHHGRKVYGKLFLPQGISQCPLVICSHGYNGSGEDFEKMGEYLADSGVAAFCYDFCGGSVHGRSSMETTEMTIFTEKEDLESCFSYFQNDSCIDSHKIFLFGGSQGGMVSALAAEDLREETAGLILMYPALCIADDWNKRFKNISDIPEEEDFWGMKLGKSFFLTLRDFKIYDQIGKYEGNVLVTHGDEDAVVPLEYSKKLQQIYNHVKLEIFHGEGHGYSRQGNKRMAQMLLEFVKSNI